MAVLAVPELFLEGSDVVAAVEQLRSAKSPRSIAASTNPTTSSMRSETVSPMLPVCSVNIFPLAHHRFMRLIMQNPR
jgi:hypothetical protein